jgi:hypothetical protein
MIHGLTNVIFLSTTTPFFQWQRAVSTGNLCDKLTVSYLANNFSSFTETESLLPCYKHSKVCPTLSQMKPGRLPSPYLFKTAVRRFSRKLGALSKFQATQMWYEVPYWRSTNIRDHSKYIYIYIHICTATSPLAFVHPCLKDTRKLIKKICNAFQSYWP